jgi:hypothetical protein
MGSTERDSWQYTLGKYTPLINRFTTLLGTSPRHRRLIVVLIHECKAIATARNRCNRHSLLWLACCELAT